MRHRLNPAIALAHPPVPVTFGRGSFVPPLVFGALFAGIGFKVGLPVALAAVMGAFAGTGSLLVHEFGHIRAARHLHGVRPVGVSLIWLGAGARFEGAYMSGRDQMKVALAGPVASMCAAVSLMPIMFLPIPAMAKKLLLIVILLNGALAVVNLLPASPLDGYKMTMGLLWSVLGSEATARHIIRRAAHAWITVEVAGTIVALFERPALGVLMVVASTSLFGQKLVGRSRLTSRRLP